MPVSLRYGSAVVLIGQARCMFLRGLLDSVVT